MLRHAIGVISFQGLVIALVMLASPACSKETELIGFGKYELGKTTPADDHVMGKCRPEGADTFCFLNRSPSIAGHKTQTDLYFQGREETAPLIEIQVGVWNCHPQEVGVDLQAKLGEPTKTANKRALWSLKKMTVIALLPKEDGLCTVHFLALSETERVADLFASEEAPSVKTP